MKIDPVLSVETTTSRMSQYNYYFIKTKKDCVGKPFLAEPINTRLGVIGIPGDIFTFFWASADGYLTGGDDATYLWERSTDED